MRRRALLLLATLVITATASAQSTIRRATNIQALVTHSSFYHLRPVLIVGKLELKDTGELRVIGDSSSMRMVYKGSTPDGLSEIRGELWDIGRFGPDDPHLAGYDVKASFGVDPAGPWPKPGQTTIFVATAVAPATQPSAPSIRNISLFPARYLEQKVTLTGQFGGRNLLGDLPESPGQSRYDFVLRSADAAIWVTNLRPRGKDFELAVDARIDTRRWLEVSGTLQQGRGLQWLDGGQGGSVRAASPPKESAEEVIVRLPTAPPPEVIFSTPTQGETDVGTSTRVRIQFSRDIDGATIRGHLRVSYVEEAGGNPPAAPVPVAVTTQYLPGNRVLEVRITNPLDPFRRVKVEFLEGVAGTDKQPLKPWTLEFETGGQ